MVQIDSGLTLWIHDSHGDVESSCAPRDNVDTCEGPDPFEQTQIHDWIWGV